MTKSSTNENVKEQYDIPHTSTWDGPNLKGDWLNFFLLILFYTMQGIPIGFSLGLPILFQSKKIVTYDDQSSFSFVLWPYSMKILWVPMVDTLFIPWIGRRKSWFIPVQYSMGALFFHLANNIDAYLPESGKPNLKMITLVLFLLNLMTTTQDIVVDGWSLTMLKKKNVSYSSTCNGTGVALGMFIGSVCPILLESEDFSNRYLRIKPSAGGIMSIKNVLYLWSILYLLMTTLVAILKKEQDIRLEDNYVKISVYENYKLLWKVVKLPSMRVLIIAILTSLIGFSTVESLVDLKLIDAGIPKDNIMMINTALFVIKIFGPLIVAKYITGKKPIGLYLQLTPIRLLWCLTFAALIYYTPILIKSNSVVNIPMYYYLIIGFIYAINEILMIIMLLSIFAFFSRISDPRFGGTYMAILNTVRNLGWITSKTLLLKMVNILTFKKCEQNNCSTTDFKNTCTTFLNCVVLVDGYYIEVFLCLFIGFIWYTVFKSHLKKLQSKNCSHWIVELK